ncbi:MAG: hypothetical protein ABIG92_03550 [Candidatus Omnitrophota bacterium]
MKKIFIIMLVFSFIFGSISYGETIKIFEARNKIFNESNKIRSGLKDSKNILLMTSMWDTCLVAVKQVDAYFYMIRIFDTIDPKNIKEEAVISLENWLNNIKKTDIVNIDSLNGLMKNEEALEAKAALYMTNLKEYFVELNKEIDMEIERLKEIKIQF